MLFISFFVIQVKRKSDEICVVNKDDIRNEIHC